MRTGIKTVMHRFYAVSLGVAAALVGLGVASAEDTDRGAKIGLRWLMGPFEIMNSIGIDKTFDAVEAVTKRYTDFNMPGILLKQKEKGKPFDFNFVDLEVKDGIACITINRPEAMNALNEVVVSQIAERFADAEKNSEVHAVVFQGAGKAFVAGADIRYFVKKIKAGKISDIVDYTKKGHDLFLRIENSDKITIALLDGLSLGGGSELALSCQAIVATHEGSMAFPETGIGIYPALGGMIRMSRHAGPELAKYYVFTGSAISAKDAHELGIVNAIASRAETEAAIRDVVRRGKPDKYRRRDLPDKFKKFAALCSHANIERLLAGKIPEGADEADAAKTLKAYSFKAPAALRLSGEIIDTQTGRSIEEAAEIEIKRLEEIFSTEDALEGLSSVGRKKRPEFKGK